MCSDITLLCEGSSFVIEREWVARWEFLLDLIEDGEVTSQGPVTWTYTAADELYLWIQLNHNMTNEASPSPLPPLSSLKKVIDFMRPVTTSWVSYIHIDQLVPEHERRDLYLALGLSIRKAGVRHSYSTSERGLPEDFFLWCDPAYLIEGRHRLIRAHQATQQLILDIEDISVLTGIVHSMMNDSGEVRWRDIALMVSNPYLLDPSVHDNGNGLLGVSKADYLSYLLKPTGHNYLAHVMADLPLPSTGNGVLPLEVSSNPREDEMTALVRFAGKVPDEYLSHFVDRSGLEDYMGGYRIQGDGVSHLFSQFSRGSDNTRFRSAADLIKILYGATGIASYINLLQRYKKVIHLVSGRVNRIEKINLFISALSH